MFCQPMPPSEPLRVFISYARKDGLRSPSDHALVLCVNEKSQIQALNRTQPVQPMGMGYVEGTTHDYVRYGA